MESTTLPAENTEAGLQTFWIKPWTVIAHGDGGVAFRIKHPQNSDVAFRFAVCIVTIGDELNESTHDVIVHRLVGILSKCSLGVFDASLLRHRLPLSA